MNVTEAINKRHSYRGKYLPEPVSHNDLVKIMEAGKQAASNAGRHCFS